MQLRYLDERKGDREQLVEQIRLHTGIEDPRLLSAFRRVPRHRFVPEAQREYAYEDRALPIGSGQTISQPSMIALMLQALECRPGDRALEVGAGSGYAAALLAELVAEVHAIEVLPELAEKATRTLQELEIGNATVYVGNGALGLSGKAPFDRILVSAGAEHVPPALVTELAPHGRIAIPVGGELAQDLMVGERTGAAHIEWEKSTPCIFVPLVGNEPARA